MTANKQHTHVSETRPIIILGPTASGKTRVAVELARQINGAVISVDSRQVYRDLDIGTGKDLAEYDDVPYAMIDVQDPQNHYHVSNYLADVQKAHRDIRAKGYTPIFCGGSGLYLQGILNGLAYSGVPRNDELREALQVLDSQELLNKLQNYPLPNDFKADTSTTKRLIRAIEISAWVQKNPAYARQEALCPDARVFGIAPERNIRRQLITNRLHHRLKNGMIDEVRTLLADGLPAERLISFGLEYKYTTEHLLGHWTYTEYLSRLETEIHRFAKRQMTFFRKMEKDGIPIHWAPYSSTEVMAKYIREAL